MKTSSVIQSEFVCVNEKATMRDTAGLLIKNKISGMPVVNNKSELVGFISERDIIRAVSQGSPGTKPTREVMTKKPIALQENTAIKDASKIFHKYPFRYIPVVRKKKVVGVVTRKDVIDKLMRQYY